MRRIIACILAIAMVMSLAVTCVTAADEVDATLITTAEQFANMEADGNYKLGADITISATYANAFTGTFDGNGKTVTTTVPLFAEFEGTAKNVIISGAIDTSSVICDTGAFASAVNGNASFTNIRNNASVKGFLAGESSDSSKRTCAGGVVGIISSGIVSFSECVNTAEISGRIAGGIVGCYYDAAKSNDSSVCSLSFTNCTNTGHISVSESDEGTMATRVAGGILGSGYFLAYFTFAGCVNNGKVEADDACNGSAGGICGYNSTSITEKNIGFVNFTDCSNLGEIISSGSYAGGVCAAIRNNSSFINCNNSGCIHSGINGSDICSGVCGGIAACVGTAGSELTSIFTNCINKGNVESGRNYAGGIVAVHYAGDITFTECINYGNVNIIDSQYINTKTTLTCGGILGYHSQNKKSGSSQLGSIVTLKNCINHGQIKSYNQHAGGLIGYVYGTDIQYPVIEECVNYGDITGKFTSQFIAYVNSANAVIKNCIGAGSVNAIEGGYCVISGCSSQKIVNVSGIYLVENDGTEWYSYATSDHVESNRIYLDKVYSGAIVNEAYSTTNPGVIKRIKASEVDAYVSLLIPSVLPEDYAGGGLDSGTYILSKDLVLEKPVYIPSGANVIINLNGHSIQTSYTGEYVDNNGTLYIYDANGEDKTSYYAGVSALRSDYTGGTLESGTYRLEENITLSTPIVVESGAVVTLNLNGYSIQTSYTGKYVENNGTLNVDDDKSLTEYYLDTYMISSDFTGGILSSGIYQLKSDLTLTEPIVIADGSAVKLDLNNCVVNANGTGRAIINYGTLEINDGDEPSNHRHFSLMENDIYGFDFVWHYFTYHTDGAWTYKDNASDEEKSSAIYYTLTSSGTADGTLIRINGACITGGYVSDIGDNDGAAIYNTGKLTYNGGAIIGNKAVAANDDGACGGAIYNSGELIMNGGFSEDEYGNQGYCGGYILGNSVSGDTGTDADNCGGAIYNNGTINISGGDIRFNTALGDGNDCLGFGGAICIESGDLVVSGNSAFQIYYNKADIGGAISITDGCFTHRHGEIYTTIYFEINDNYAALMGGGIYESNTVFELDGLVDISDNASGGAGSNLYVDNGKFTFDPGFWQFYKIGVSGNATDGSPVIFTDSSSIDISKYFTDDDDEVSLRTTEDGALMLWAPTTLKVEGTEAYNKTYDGTTVAGVSLGQVSGVYGDDDVQVIISSAVFIDKNAGANKEVYVTYALTGEDAKYYLAPAPETIYADIAPKSLTVSGTKVLDKEADESVSASVLPGTLEGVVDGDEVTFSVSAAFETPDVGENKKVNITYTLGGKDAANYSLNASAEATATVYSKSAEMAKDASKVLDKVEEAAGEVSEFLKHVDGISEEVTEILDNVEELAGKAGELAEKIIENPEVVDEILDAIENPEETVEQIREAVEEKAEEVAEELNNLAQELIKNPEKVIIGAKEKITEEATLDLSGIKDFAEAVNEITGLSTEQLAQTVGISEENFENVTETVSVNLGEAMEVAEEAANTAQTVLTKAKNIGNLIWDAFN